MMRNKILILLVTNILIIGLMGNVTAIVQNTGTYPGDSFIDPTVVINTDNFTIEQESYVAPFTIFRGGDIHIGNHSNVQDNGNITGNFTTEEDSVIAHNVGIKGTVEIGDNVFIGFNSIVQDSTIGSGAYIGIGSKIIGVEIPPYKSVPPGSTIDSQAKADQLQDVTDSQTQFVGEVVEVNRALAIGYSDLYNSKGLGAFGPVGPNGDGDIFIDELDILARHGSDQPVIGNNVIFNNVRIIGKVSIGDDSKIGNRTSIRGDEGIPIAIGKNAQIGEGDTFHSLNNKEIKIGDNFKVGNDAVIHGPLMVGNNVIVGNTSVIFNSTIGNNVDIGDNAIVVGVNIPDGTVVPSNNITINQPETSNTVEEVDSNESNATTTATVMVTVTDIVTPTNTVIPTKEEPNITYVEKTEEKPIPTVTPQSPGFEGIIGMIGMVLVVYVLRRR